VAGMARGVGPGELIGPGEDVHVPSHGPAAGSDAAESPAPASDRFCDALVLAFALWTVSSHLVVVAGGGT
jgi:hypothetical protein